MSATTPGNEPDFLLDHAKEKTERSWAPWIVAGVVVVIGLGVLIFMGGRKQAAAPAGPGLAPLDPYASNLVISGLVMSESSNFAGGKVTYVDGQIANRGGQTVSAVTVQAVFRNSLNEVGLKEAMAVNLIRTHEPYVDTQPVSAAPIRPGDQREFRLIFDHVPEDWNQQYPEIRVIRVEAK
jgi:hypothetical protein